MYLDLLITIVKSVGLTILFALLSIILIFVLLVLYEFLKIIFN